MAYLNQYRVLSTNDERTARALWGMLASEILNRNWDAALEELNRLKEIIDSKVFLSHLLIVFSLLRLHLYMVCFISYLEFLWQNFSSPLNQLQDRIWLMHWSLFIFFHHENGRNGIIDLFFQDRFVY